MGRLEIRDEDDGDTLGFWRLALKGGDVSTGLVGDDGA